jgi:hypothetical protein
MVNLAKRVLIRLLGRDNALRLYITANRLQRSVREQFFEEKDACAVPWQRFAIEDCHTFFGYYDKTPFSADNSRVLALVAPRQRKVLRNEAVSLGYFDRSIGTFYPVSRTSTWNWQQGCRLQWFPQDGDKLILFNKLVSDGYGACVQDVETKEIIKIYRYPIYETDRQGTWALTLNFSRLHRLRPGYGYALLLDPTQGELAPREDGVWRLNLTTGEAELIFSLEQLAALDPVASMKGADHYVNHLAFNPSGKRFMCFHLWMVQGRRRGRLITSDLHGRQIRVLTDSGIVSHYAWKSDDELLITFSDEDGGMGYYLVSDGDKDKVAVGPGVLTVDGHPSYSPDGRFLLTDTYPDRYGERRLLLYAIEGNLIELGRFFSPICLRGEVRCDLHPRWDRTGRLICLDSAHEGRRALYVADVEAMIAQVMGSLR